MTRISFEELFRRYRKIAGQHALHLSLYWDLIRLSHQIYAAVSRKREAAILAGGEPIDGPAAILDIYELKMLHHFVAHHTCLKQGVSIGSYVHARTAFEAAISVYLIRCDKAAAKLIFDYEILDSFPEPERSQIMRNYQRNNYYRPSQIMKLIYDGGRVDQMKNFYSHLSKLSHPSLLSGTSQYQVRPDVWKDSMQLGMGLAVANLLLLCELYGALIDKRYLRRMRELIERSKPYLPAVPLIIPNKDVCRSELLYPTYPAFIKMLQTVH